VRKENIELNTWDRNRAEKFTDLRCGEDQSLYKNRGGFKREDILVGALGEIAVSKYLQALGFAVNDPDFAIYEKGKKSFDCDLTDGNRLFHVKCQSRWSAKKYGKSWLLQRRDPLVNKPTSKDYVIPCVVDLDTNSVNIWGVISFKAIVKNGKVGECAVHQLRNSKVALYLNELTELSSSIRWGVINRYNKEGK
jgi:hypothetical protein